MNVVTIERRRVVIEPGTPVDRWFVSSPGLGCISSTEERPSARRVEQLIGLAVLDRRRVIRE